jgi:hypothetical protein
MSVKRRPSEPLVSIGAALVPLSGTTSGPRPAHTRVRERRGLSQPRDEIVGVELLRMRHARLVELLARRRIVPDGEGGLPFRFEPLVVLFPLLDLRERVGNRLLAGKRLIGLPQLGGASLNRPF